MGRVLFREGSKRTPEDSSPKKTASLKFSLVLDLLRTRNTTTGCPQYKHVR